MNVEYRGNYQKIMIIIVSDGGTKCERYDKIFESFFIIVELKCAMFDHQTVKNVCVMFVRPKNIVDFWPDAMGPSPPVKQAAATRRLGNMFDEKKDEKKKNF